jgi:sorting nexin-1/2
MVVRDDEKFIEERRALLERFMKDIAKHEYIQKSSEFKVFTRGKGDVDKVLNDFPKPTPMELLTKYRESFKIDEEQEGSAMDTYRDRIQSFQAFLRKTIGLMEMQRKQMRNMESVRERQDKSTTEMMTHLMKFEEVGIEYYAD